MNDQEQQQRERAYKIWEDEGRPDGAHEEHWKRAETVGASPTEEEDATIVNQKANDQFNEGGDRAKNPADIRPPSTVAPD
jgi:hypothetical protein